MKYCDGLIKNRLDFTEKLYGFAKHGTRRKTELSKMCRDYKEAHDFLTGKIEAVSFVPEYSIRELKRQFLWLNYDRELHSDAIEEIDYYVNKMKEDGKDNIDNR